MITQATVKVLGKPIVGLLLWSALSVFSTPAEAMTVYNLNYVFSPEPGHTVAPMGTVTLTDVGTAVQFDIVNKAGAGSKLDSLYSTFITAPRIPINSRLRT